MTNTKSSKKSSSSSKSVPKKIVKKTVSKKITKKSTKSAVRKSLQKTAKNTIKKVVKKTSQVIKKIIKLKSDNKSLIVYYSRTGHSERIATLLSKEVKSDIEILEDLTPRKGFFSLVKASFDTIKEKTTIIGALKYDPHNYKNVILISPLWAGRIPPALRTYVKCLDNKVISIVSICSAGGDNPSKYFTQLESLLGNNLHSRIIISTKDYQDDLDLLIKEIAKGLK